MQPSPIAETFSGPSRLVFIVDTCFGQWGKSTAARVPRVPIDRQATKGEMLTKVLSADVNNLTDLDVPNT
jgi:hypothetical protein